MAKILHLVRIADAWCLAVAMSVLMSASQANGAVPSLVTEIASPVHSPAHHVTQATATKADSARLVVSSDAEVGLFGAMVGAGIGAIVSLIAVYLTSKQQQRIESEKRAARGRDALALVRAEIDHNFTVLSDYLRETDLGNSVRIAANQSGREWIANHPPPRWSMLAWETSLADLLGTMPNATLLSTFGLYSEFQAYTQAIELAVAYHNQRLGEEAVSTAYFVLDGLAQKLQRSANPLTS